MISTIAQRYKEPHQYIYNYLFGQNILAIYKTVVKCFVLSIVKKKTFLQLLSFSGMVVLKINSKNDITVNYTVGDKLNFVVNFKILLIYMNVNNINN